MEFSGSSISQPTLTPLRFRHTAADMYTPVKNSVGFQPSSTSRASHRKVSHQLPTFENFSALKSKYDALKLENQRLQGILHRQTSQGRDLELRLRNLEKEFSRYKRTCENLLAQPPQASHLLDRASAMFRKLETCPSFYQRVQQQGFSATKFKEYLKTQRLDKALVVALKLSVDLLDHTSSRPQIADECLLKLSQESEVLIKHINKQSSKIAQLIEGCRPESQAERRSA